jgi:molybdopterin converting factor small subunit
MVILRPGAFRSKVLSVLNRHAPSRRYSDERGELRNGTQEDTRVRLNVEAWPPHGGVFGGTPGRRHAFTLSIGEDETLATVVTTLREQFPAFDALVRDPGSDTPRGIGLVLNGRVPELHEGMLTRIRDGDRLVIFSAFDGG